MMLIILIFISLGTAFIMGAVYIVLKIIKIAETSKTEAVMIPRLEIKVLLFGGVALFILGFIGCIGMKIFGGM